MNSARPIKILHVVFSLEAGGMENGLVNVARGLPAEEFEFHVACLERSGPFAARMPQPENVHVLGKPNGFSPRAIWDLRRLIRRIQPDIIHTHNLGTLIYGRLAAMGGHWKILQGEHCLLPSYELTPRRLLQRRWLYRSCAAVHTVAEGVRQQLIEFDFPAEKISTILNGVDCERFQLGNRAAARRKIGIVPENAVVVGIVGRFVWQKGHARLIEAFEKIHATHPDVHLLVVGDGGDQQEKVLAQARGSSAAAHIHFAGYQGDLTPYYQALDLMIAPSTLEGLSNVVIEAMACGVPVLAHPACGNPEVLTHGQTGFIAELDTAEKIQRELTQILARANELPAIGQAARASAVQNLSLAKMVENYRQLYRRTFAAKN